VFPANWYIPEIYTCSLPGITQGHLWHHSLQCDMKTHHLFFGSTGNAVYSFSATTLAKGLSSLKWISKERSSILIQLWQNFWVRENVWLENVRFGWREDTAHHFKYPQKSSVQWLWWTVCIIDLSWSHHTHTITGGFVPLCSFFSCHNHEHALGNLIHINLRKK
jgi:hypothetical protein